METASLHSVQFFGAAGAAPRRNWNTIPRLYLKEWREYYKWTQVELGERVSRDGGTISRWEGGDPVTSENLVQLAKAFNCDVPELFQQPHPPTPFERLQSIVPSNDLEAMDLIERIARLVMDFRR